MAAGIAYLSGGPCDGRTHKVTPAEGDTGYIVCKGGRYNVTNPAKYRRGNLVFAYAGKYEPPGQAQPIKAAHLHKGYADLQRSVNRNLPSSLHTSRRYLAAGLRSVARARKVPL